jgi:STE24 endopeptidase
MGFTMFIAPVFIAPMFNKYTKLEDPKLKDPIINLARANGVGAKDVWVFDASKQHNRVSANVSGFLGTQRISLNDNLINRCSLEEIESVMAHEIGHYVLNHIVKSFIFFFILIVVGFWLVKWSFDRILKRFGDRFGGIDGPGDVAGMPLFFLLISTFFFLTTPATNSWTRMQEKEADLFGLNASRVPDAQAEVELKVGEYRKTDPGPVEEIIFFHHPSTVSRVRMAMQLKSANLE